jgi:uncharacterized protein (TIGR00297 family)
MTSAPARQPWTKAIPPKAISPARDQLQSRLLVWIAVPILCYLSYEAIRYTTAAGHSGRVYLSMALAISVFFALAAWRLKAATPAAAACGGLICFSVTILSGRPDGPSPLHSGLSPLVLLFVLTFQATRLGRQRKAANGIAEDRKGRNAAQVIANLGVAAWASSYLYSIFGQPHHGFQWPYIVAAFQGPMLAALAESTADTVSSEIGQAFGGMPFMLTTLRRVPPGTDGAISLNGTIAGVAAAALIAVTGAPALGMELDECMVVFVAAIAGLFFDSLLGATIERWGWVGNDLVNLASTLFAAAVALWVQGILGQMSFA